MAIDSERVLIVGGSSWSNDDRAKFMVAWLNAKHSLARPYLVMTEERTGADDEKVVNDVLDILAKDRVSRGAAEQIKGAAEQSIRRQDGAGALGRAIRR